MNLFTVFTPTYNRSKTLGRVYQSLLKQTDKEFVWLIVDDGSSDNTKELVEIWQSEGEIEIEYYYKKNEGKITAMHFAYQLAKTKYIISIDSDDELTPKAVEVFRLEWSNIEKANLESQFAVIAAMTTFTDGNLNGNFHFPEGIEFMDASYHEMVLKYRNNNENIVSWNLHKLREYVNIPEQIWLNDRVDYPIHITEGVLWARMGRKYKTRYINRVLRIYHLDGGDSILRVTNKSRGFYDNLVGHKYFLDENLDQFFMNPKYFINPILKFIVSSIELNYSPSFIFKNINSWQLKIAFMFSYPIAIIMWLYFKYIKKQFWF